MKKRRWLPWFLTVICLLMLAGLTANAGETVNWNTEQAYDYDAGFGNSLQAVFDPTQTGQCIMIRNNMRSGAAEEIVYLGIKDEPEEQFLISIYDSAKNLYAKKTVVGTDADYLKITLKNKELYYVTVNPLRSDRKDPITFQMAPNYASVIYRGTYLNTPEVVTVRKDEPFYLKDLTQDDIKYPALNLPRLEFYAWLEGGEKPSEATMIYYADKDGAKTRGYAFDTPYLSVFENGIRLNAWIYNPNLGEHSWITIHTQGGTNTDTYTGLCTRNQDGTYSYTFEQHDVAVKPGYRLLGWSVNPHAETPEYHVGDTIKNVDTKTVYYCIWEKLPELILYANDGTGSVSRVVSGDDWNVRIPGAPVAREDYQFLGWAKEPAALQALYQPGQTVSLDSNMTLYGVWKRTNGYHITYQLNGGSGAIGRSTADLSGVVTVTMQVPEKANCNFLGWSADKNAVSADCTKGQKVKIVKDTVLYAVWEPIKDALDITANLVNVNSSNPAKYAVENKAYDTVLTPASGYALDKVTVLMGGSLVPVSKSAGKCEIHIASVTEDIDILATAVKSTVQIETPSETGKIPEIKEPEAAPETEKTPEVKEEIIWKAPVMVDVTEKAGFVQTLGTFTPQPGYAECFVLIPEQGMTYYIGVTSEPYEKYEYTLYDARDRFIKREVRYGSEQNAFYILDAREASYRITIRPVTGNPTQPFTVKLTDDIITVSYSLSVFENYFARSIAESYGMDPDEVKYTGARATKLEHKSEGFTPMPVTRVSLAQTYGAEEGAIPVAWIDSEQNVSVYTEGALDAYHSWYRPLVHTTVGFLGDGPNCLSPFMSKLVFYRVVLRPLKSIREFAASVFINPNNKDYIAGQEIRNVCDWYDEGGYYRNWYTFGEDSCYTVEGYRLLGWSKDKSATSPDYVIGDVLQGASQEVIYCIWEKLPKISFNPNGGSMEPFTLTADEQHQVFMDTPIPVRGDYQFSGWSEDPAAETAEYRLGHTITFEKDTTLYAVWKSRANYALKYDLNGGTGSIEESYASNSGKVSITGQIPTREGYTFRGWSENKNAVSAAYTEGDVLTITGNKVVYAVWKSAVKYQIKGTYTHVTSSNPASSVKARKAYLTVLTPENGYELDQVTVRMSGKILTGAVEKTKASCTVIIPSVTGPVEITATAVKISSAQKPGENAAAQLKNGDIVTDPATGFKIRILDVVKKEAALAALTKTGQKTVKIPKSVSVSGAAYTIVMIDQGALKGNKVVTKVTLPSTLRSIGKEAFRGCKNLKTLTIPKKVTKIGANAFNGCKKLKTIIIKATKLTKKGVVKNAFKGLSKRTVVKVPKKKLKAYRALLKSRGFKGKVK